MLQIQALTAAFDAQLAALIRANLKAHGLDIPGTAYYDEGLDHLSEVYEGRPEEQGYWILVEGEAGDRADRAGDGSPRGLYTERAENRPLRGPENRPLRGRGACVGGVGLAKLAFMENCAELQKLYLADSVKGQGLGYRLLAFAEEQARAMGYQRIYLETHTNLQAAMHLYEKCGYQLIPRPEAVVHSTMDRFYLKKL